MVKLIKKIKKAGLDNFMLCLLGMILLAYIWPYPGTKESPLHLSTVSTFAVSAIFFFYGLKLNPQKLVMGLSNWRLHLLVQLATFMLFPLIALLIHPFFQGEVGSTLWLGIFFLCALPSTVSSSVVMVSIAQGNIPAAIFNASISSLLGVLITPLWMGIVLEGTTTSFDLLPVVGKLSYQVLFPVLMGLILNRFWGGWAERNKNRIKYLDQGSIHLIVYTSFCESFYAHLFEGLGWAKLVLLGLGMVALFIVIYGIIAMISKLLRFNREDQITALFCGSKKSLVQGAVMSKVLFVGPQAGVMLLPIMIFHAFQLIMASNIAQRMSLQLGEKSAK